MGIIKVGFIGAGDIADLHAEAVKEIPGVELLGLWNRTEARGLQKSKQYGCKLYNSHTELLADPELDAVFVLTNLETHKDFAIQAAQAGKHVLIEKPVAASISELEEIRRAVQAAGVIGMPVHNYIYEPSLERTKSLIDSGKLGQIVALYVLYNIHHPEVVCARYPGVIRQIITHHSYIQLYLVGKPVSLMAMKTTINDGSVRQENLAMVNLKLESGALAHLSASFAADDNTADAWTCMIKVIGTKGATRYSYRDWVENKPASVHSHTFSSYPCSIKNTTRHFIERCIQQGHAPLSTLEDAITCQRIIEACELSVESGQQVCIG